MEYTHLYLIDSFHAERGEKIRVTTDEKTGKVVECIMKKTLGSLNVYSPVRSADWRVSVNMETPGKGRNNSKHSLHIELFFSAVTYELSYSYPP